jgi:exodeoxyribonuclease V beta subunit
MPQHENPNFNAVTVTLAGSNLIEASAGTGKTYSIALLTLRLVIEKKIPIEKILMVTFTKAAVAELEIRVRAFVRMALKVSRGETIGDPTITNLVNDQIEIQGVKEVSDRLETAQLFLDETSVLTIHSFCQRTLSEFSFETGQIFGAETITPDEYNQMMEDAFNEYWRINVTTIRLDMLKRFIGFGLNHDDIFDLVKKSFGGKMLFSNIPMPDNFLSEAYFEALMQWESGCNTNIAETKISILDRIQLDKQNLLEKLLADRWGKASVFATLFEIEEWDENTEKLFIDSLCEKVETAYVVSIFGAYINDAVAINDLRKEIAKRFKEEVNQIAMAAIGFVTKSIQEQKNSRGIITFDDMIGLLYKAVVEGSYNQQLIASLRQKYDAVFIDEFQDTDKEQYAIFNRLFGNDKILFYIGDPKQSIYAFRKADIFTYFNAKKSVENLHFMDTNFRSTEAYINAMNYFFLPIPDFDTFYFDNDPTLKEAISYKPVRSPDPNTKGQLLCNGEAIMPIHISENKNKKELRQSVRAIIADLFTPGNYTIEKDGKSRPIKPSDIGILVRSNKEGKVMKSILASLRIPSVTIDDARLLASNEASQIFYILVAVNEISRSNINRALLSELGGYTEDDLVTTNEEAILTQFKTYQESWVKNGVYTMLKQFVSDHHVYERLYGDSAENPERTISNIQQLIEILHKITVRKNYEPKELIQWLKKGMEGDAREGDEYEQRLESDQDAVQIVTIHKSKGLEYNIVIAPHLDLLADQEVYTTGSFRDPDTGEYFVMKKDLMTDAQMELYKMQSEQENRRLIYVAITRARYQCFITINNTSHYAHSSLKKFIYKDKDPNDKKDKANTRPNDLVTISFAPPSNPGFRYTNPGAISRPSYAVANNFHLEHANWIKTSYSGLNPDHDPVIAPKTATPFETAYDKFAFQDLKKGAHTGNLLHYIFEHIDFADDRNWVRVVEQAMKRLSGSSDEAYRDNIIALLKQVTAADMPGSTPFCMNQVTKDKRINELEFDFLLSPFNTAHLQALSTEAHPFRIKSIEELEGIMNGKIDLFFEHDGKYYILDWKSNFLGNSIEFYDTNHVKAAMYENNYNLQYLIYTVALTKYLMLRKPDFDYDKDFGGVIYLFLRGVRAGKQTGIYFTKPEKQLIKDIKIVIGG